MYDCWFYTDFTVLCATLTDDIILHCVLQCCSGRDQERGDDEDSQEQHQHKVYQEMVCATVGVGVTVRI